MQVHIQRGRYRALIRILELKFNSIPEIYHQRLLQADADILLNWVDRVLEARTIAEVFEE